MRDEDERLLWTLILALLAAQMARVLKRPEWMLQDELPREAVGGALAVVASQHLFRLWTAGTTMPIPGGAWSRVTTWATQYAGTLVKGIDAVTRGLLTTQINAYVTEGWTLKQLTDAIAVIFGEARAKRIAITEVTRCYTQAGIIRAEEMALLGLPMIPRWQTSGNENVCETCNPRDDVLLGEQYIDAFGQSVSWTLEDAPPAHPNCECDLRWEVA